MRGRSTLLGLCLLLGCDDGGGARTADGSPPVDAALDAAPRDATGPDGSPDADEGVTPPADEGLADAAPADAAPADAAPDAAPLLPGVGLFRYGCPRPGQALAAEIRDDEVRMEGPDAIGGPGDFLLMNDRAAFIVTGVGPQKTYYYYPGILADAVALDGCAQAGPERFEEIAWIIARPQIADFPQSILRAFRGERIEVVSDGRDGEARVRVHGVDDIQWLVELELVKQVVLSGGRKDLSEQLGLELTVDYVLPADSRVLRIEVTARNLLPEAQPVTTGAMTLFGDTTDSQFFYDGDLSLGGFHVRLGLPWIVSTSGDGAWALTLTDANVATTHISGVDAILDANGVINPARLMPAGSGRESATFTWLFAVGDHDPNSAVRHLLAAYPRAIRGRPSALRPLSGRVVDAAGNGLAGARLTLEMRNTGGVWAPLDALISGAGGRFAGEIADTGGELRVRATLPDRLTPEPVPLGAEEAIEVAFGPAGALRYQVRDDEGRAMPAKVELWQGGRRTHFFYAVTEPRTVPVPPGQYELSVSRGIEYAIHRAPLAVPEDGTADIDVTLARLVNTDGWLSTDGHMHAGPSADSDVSLTERIESAAAAGLDVAIGTDHEIVRDWGEGVRASGLGAWIAAVGGQEITATLPEHINAYPWEADPTHFRGDPVVWYGMDLGGIYAAARERGAGVVQLNHPRQGCNYMCLVGYDRLTGGTRLQDPTLLGFFPDAELWSWDFDAIEYMNGLRSPLLDPNSPDDTGHFDDWMSFLNLGHRITAMGVTDVHSHDLGNPRTYFAAPVEVPGFEPPMLAEAIRGGRAIVSAGAFARVSIGDAGPGDLATVDGAATLAVRIEALPEIDVARFRVHVNCDQVLTVEATDPNGVVKYDGTVELPIDRDAHVVVLGFGDGPMPREIEGYDGRRTPRFTTNAIFVDADGDGVWTPPGGKACAYDR